MESDQQIAETGMAVSEMDLQDTVRIPLDEEEQEEIFHDSMTEEQWKQQLGVPTAGIEESRAGQYPPTHTDEEGERLPQLLRDAEAGPERRVSREIQMLRSHNTKGTEEMEVETLQRQRRRATPLKELIQEFEFYERKADSLEVSLPHERTGDDIPETKRTFNEFKVNVDGMRHTGGRITEKLTIDGRVTEAREYNERINRKRQVVVEMRNLYWEVLSTTDTWQPGAGYQSDGIGRHGPLSDTGSRRSRRSETSGRRNDEELQILGDIAQIQTTQKKMREAEDLARKVEEMKSQAKVDGLKARLMVISEEPNEDESTRSPTLSLRTINRTREQISETTPLVLKKD